MASPPGRIEIIEAVMQALEPLPWVTTLWMNGAVSAGRVDKWSDVDLNVDAEDKLTWKVFPIVEEALERLAPIEARHRSPTPPDHDYEQIFYRLKGTDPFHFVDLAVFRNSARQKYLEPVEFGTPRILFDKTLGAVIPRFDARALADRIGHRLEFLQSQHRMFSRLVEKELARGHLIEAHARYRQYLLLPLIELLRIQHRPEHFQYNLEDVDYDLPEPVLKRVVRYSFVKDEADLRIKAPQVEAWIAECLAAAQPGVISLPGASPGVPQSGPAPMHSRG